MPLLFVLLRKISAMNSNTETTKKTSTMMDSLFFSHRLRLSMDIFSMMMPKNEPLDLSDVESYFDGSGSPASDLSYESPFDYQDPECFSPQNLPYPMHAGSQSVDFDYQDFNQTKNTMDFKIKQKTECSVDFSTLFTMESNMGYQYNYRDESNLSNWSNRQTNMPELSHYQPSQDQSQHYHQTTGDTQYQTLFQQQSYMGMLSEEKENEMANIFQMDHTKSNRDLHQQVLYDLLKQQDANFGHQTDNFSNLSIPSPQSPSSNYDPIVPSPQPYMERENDFGGIREKYGDGNGMECMDAEMLIKTFKTIADFVDNDSAKTNCTRQKEDLPPTKPKRKRSRQRGSNGGAGKPRLFNFLREILEDPVNYSCIEWVNKSSGLFKFLDSAEVARLWGYRKNKPMMKYENFARSLRTYIAKGILTKPRNKLVYCFAKPLPA